MGKDWAGPFFPPSLIFRSSIDCFVFHFMLLFHSILTFMKDLYQSENQVFNPTRLLVLLHCWVGKDWAGPFFPPPKSFDFSIDQLVFQFMLLFHCILTLMNDRFQRENQVFKPNILFVLLHCGVGKNWASPFFPPSKMLDLSIYPLDFWIMLFFCCIRTLLTYTKQRIKFSNQQVYS